MDKSVILDAIRRSHEAGLTVDEALTHYQLAGGAANKGAEHWVSIAFGVSRVWRDAASGGQFTEFPRKGPNLL